MHKRFPKLRKVRRQTSRWGARTAQSRPPAPALGSAASASAASLAAPPCRTPPQRAPDFRFVQRRNAAPVVRPTATRVRGALRPERRRDTRRVSTPLSRHLEHAHDRSQHHLRGLHAPPERARRDPRPSTTSARPGKRRTPGAVHRMHRTPVFDEGDRAGPAVRAARAGYGGDCREGDRRDGCRRQGALGPGGALYHCAASFR